MGYTTIKVLSIIQFLGQSNSITKDIISKVNPTQLMKFSGLLFKLR
jgi:hypothetical protein